MRFSIMKGYKAMKYSVVKELTYPLDTFLEQGCDLALA